MQKDRVGRGGEIINREGRREGGRKEEGERLRVSK